MKGNSIFITEKAINRADMVAIVLHEILHAVYAIEHVDGCKLMSASVIGCTDAEAYELFQQYAK